MSSRTQQVFSVCLLLVGSLTLTQCAPATTTAPPTSALPAATSTLSATTAAPSAPMKGGTVTIAYYQEPNTLNQMIATQTVAQDIGAFMIEGLLGIDDKGNFIPVLAKDVPTTANGGVSTDGLTVTYHLKDNLKWSDGVPLTCDDVVFTWQAILNPKSGAVSTEGFSDIDSITCPDPQTVVVKYKKFFAPYLTLFTILHGPIMPRHGNTGDPANMPKWDYNRAPIGTGPFMQKDWKVGDHMTLIRNPYYREPGKPYLDSIIARFTPSREVALQLLKTGEVDAVWDALESDIPGLDAMASSGVKYTAVPSTASERLVLNLADPQIDAPPPDQVPDHPHPILGDLRVRQAIQLGINKQLLVDKLLYGKSTVATNELHEGWAKCDFPPSEFNPDKAKQLLDQAGWVPGPDGIRVAKGAKYAPDGTRLRLKLQTTTGDKTREDTEQILIEEMKSIGIEMYIQNVPSSVLFGTWSAGAFRKHGNFDILMYTTNPDIADPQSQMAGYFASDKMPTAANNGAGFNYARWINKDYDTLIQKAASVPDLNQRRDLYCQASKLIVQELPHLYLYNRLQIAAYRDRLQGWQMANNDPPGLVFNVENWWVK